MDRAESAAIPIWTSIIFYCFSGKKVIPLFYSIFLHRRIGSGHLLPALLRFPTPATLPHSDEKPTLSLPLKHLMIRAGPFSHCCPADRLRSHPAGRHRGSVTARHRACGAGPSMPFRSPTSPRFLQRAFPCRKMRAFPPADRPPGPSAADLPGPQSRIHRLVRRQGHRPHLQSPTTPTARNKPIRNPAFLWLTMQKPAHWRW